MIMGVHHKRAFPQAYEQSCFLDGAEISTWVFAPGLLNIQKLYKYLWGRLELGDQQNEGSFLSKACRLKRLMELKTKVLKFD